MKVAVLFSGGLDSLACAVWAAREYGRENVTLIHFLYGQSYLNEEADAVTYLACELSLSLHPQTIRCLKEDRETGYVPYRNAVFIMNIAAMGYDVVVFGMLDGESPADKNPAFIRKIQNLLDSQAGPSVYGEQKRCVVKTPFRKYTKTELVEWLLERLMGYGLISATVGCLKSGNCGACMGCLNRWIAFFLTEIPVADNTTEYPPEWALGHLKEIVKQRKRGSGLFRIGFLWHRRWALMEYYIALTKYCKSIYGVGLVTYLLRDLQ